MQEFAVTSYHRIERQRLEFVRKHQDTIKADSYKSVFDAITNDDEVNPSGFGQRTILPPTYYGSPRWYNKKYLDGMALVRQFGCPNLFLTITANAKWPEITESLNPGEESTDRPDIVERVFEMKLRELLHDLKNNHVLGKVKALMWVREYQKRGN